METQGLRSRDPVLASNQGNPVNRYISFSQGRLYRQLHGSATHLLIARWINTLTFTLSFGLSFYRSGKEIGYPQTPGSRWWESVNVERINFGWLPRNLHTHSRERWRLIFSNCDMKQWSVSWRRVIKKYYTDANLKAKKQGQLQKKVTIVDSFSLIHGLYFYRILMSRKDQLCLRKERCHNCN